jgi:TonB family protein
MRLSIASSALGAALVLAPVTAGYAPALCQDFSITNQGEPSSAWRRDVMSELQAWWEAHAYYPRHASNNDEGGTVKVHLAILPDGRIWNVDVVGSSGSRSLDTAGDAVFRGGFVRPSPTAGEPQFDIDLSLHYVLAHRHDQPVPAGYTPVVSNSPFTITNEPVKSPVLETTLQRVCTGRLVLGGIANHPIYGMRHWAEAIFFRKPDGTPWVKFNEGSTPVLSPVTEIGNMLTWPGRLRIGSGTFYQYTVWPDGDNHLSGIIGGRTFNKFGIAYNHNVAGTRVELTCATEVLPVTTWNELLAVPTTTSPVDLSSVDPP